MEIDHKKCNTKQSSSSSVVVVMVPFIAQSHLNALLQLSRIISSYNIPVHYLSSDLHNSRVKSRAIIASKHSFTNPNSHDDLEYFTKIQFHDFPIPSPDNLSLSANDTSSLPRVRQSVDAFIHSLASSSSTTRVVVIYDLIMAYCVPNNVESYAFISISAFSSFTLLWQAMGKSVDDLEAVINHCKLPHDERSIYLITCLLELNKYVKSGGKYSQGVLYNTCRSIEGTFLDLLASDKEIQGEEKQWAVGPLYPLPLVLSNNKMIRSNKCLEWLDKQEPNSVLYVSFGTCVTLLDEEIKELALGLEQSGTKFLWALRDADKKDVISDDDAIIKKPNQLPLGFEERVEGMGMGIVVREWAPQLEILGHSSTGGFMSHCGWNSCMESISMGVPIAAWPIHSDQPHNAVLITELLKVGLSVREWEKREGLLVSSSMVKEAVERLMKSDEGDEMRKRAEALGCQARKAIDEGVVRMEWDSFISHITREG